jgi:hypothetical protein
MLFLSHFQLTSPAVCVLEGLDPLLHPPSFGINSTFCGRWNRPDSYLNAVAWSLRVCDLVHRRLYHAIFSADERFISMEFCQYSEWILGAYS